MRLARFDLTAFGHFTGTSLAFPAGSPDMHVIHGPNEAGKSTLRVALLEWLYGIHSQSSFDFKHGYGKMELGGQLDDPALGVLEFRRLKRMRNSALDTAGNPVSDTELARWLLRTDRDSYRRMFAIEHKQLVAGDQAITNAGNDIGRILFGAAAGLGNLGELRAKIDDEVEDLWGPHRRKGHQFTQADVRFVAARDKLTEVSLSAAQWQEAKNALDAARSAEAAAEAELASLGKRQRQLERVTRVAGPLARWDEATIARQVLGTPVAFPEDAASTFAAAEKTLGDAQVKRDLAIETITRDQRALAALTLSPVVTAHADDIEDLSERRAVVLNAQADLPTVARELADAEADIARAAAGLGWTDTTVAGVTAALPSPVIRADLAAHLKEHAALALAAETAQRDLRGKEVEVARLTDLLTTAADAAELPDLVQAHGEAQALNYGPALTAAQRAAEKAETALAAARSGLEPWTGTDADLPSPLFPTTAEAATYTKERAGLEASRRNVHDQLERDETALAHAQREVDAHTRLHTPVTPETVQTQRAVRDHLWSVIRAGEPVATHADRYEQAVRSADVAADDRFEDADFVAKARELDNTRQAREIDRDAARTRLGRGEQELADFDARWRERLARAPGGTFVPLDQYATWAKARDTLLATLTAAQGARDAKGALDERAATLAETIRAACAATRTPCPAGAFAVTLTHAASVISQRSEARVRQQGWRTDLATQKALAATARDDHAAAAAVLARWEARRDELLAKTGITPDTGNEGAQAALQMQEGLVQAVRTDKSLAVRVSAMRDKIAAFNTDAQALVTACAPDLAGKSAIEAALALKGRADAEHDLVAEHARLTAALADAQGRLATIAEDEAQARATVAPLMAIAKITTMDELRASIARWESCSAADAKVAAEREAVVNTGDGLPFDTLVAEATVEDLTAIPDELAVLARNAAETDVHRTQAVEVRTNVQNALNKYAGQDDAVRAEADKQDALLLMREAAEGYFRQALVAKLLAWATKRYAEHKHGPLLQRASGIFDRLTLHNFDRLALGQDGAETKLYAYRPDGSHIVFGKGLSTGTESQLYLALRLASLEQHIEDGNVLPFLGDDLLMGWDEERVAAGIGVLADFAKKTQVILLTHSGKVAEIAKEILGGAGSIAMLPRNMSWAA